MSRLKAGGLVKEIDLAKEEIDDMFAELEHRQSKPKEEVKKTFCQWNSHGPDIFSAIGATQPRVPAGLYSVEENPQIGNHLKRINFSVANLINFPQTNSSEIISDIKKFWGLKDKYKAVKQKYKRGYLLVGGQGLGKSSTLNMVVNDLIKEDGVAIKFTNPYRFESFMQSFRQVEPDRQVVVLMEDIESTIEEWDESTILNILDGVGEIDHVVYLATTNYPDKLLGRITNRPSRFDRVFEFKEPNEETKRIYLESLSADYMTDRKELIDLDIDQWIKDTKELTMAHLKELFLSVHIFGYDYKDTLKKLKGMKNKLKGADDESGKKVGFD